MMEDHDCSALPELSVSFPGPFTHHDVVVNGWRVPYLQAHVTAEDRVMLVIDRHPSDGRWYLGSRLDAPRDRRPARFKLTHYTEP
jgi:hypothetical protein